MRRVLVIVLTLLFPLNVMALSMSASLLQAGPLSTPAPAPAPAPESALSPSFAADSHTGQHLACAPACDRDPDEPPGHQDLHDIVYRETAPRLTGPAAPAALGQDASRPFDSPAPPVKPPRS
ncbi:hypothetical protein [Massilia sp. H6]|uniref:hypothetical protein n=1 Tax=Massilia sp. H6 TaxID=2970464 RepID=UPI00216A3F8A|nr:hypothetical protein [Massilia sp. H6]UVW29904.1 hypothetical protein NRS07_07235 [Massilia sp. H6]